MNIEIFKSIIEKVKSLLVDPKDHPIVHKHVIHLDNPYREYFKNGQWGEKDPKTGILILGPDPHTIKIVLDDPWAPTEWGVGETIVACNPKAITRIFKI